MNKVILGIAAVLIFSVTPATTAETLDPYSKCVLETAKAHDACKSKVTSQGGKEACDKVADKALKACEAVLYPSKKK